MDLSQHVRVTADSESSSQTSDDLHHFITIPISQTHAHTRGNLVQPCFTKGPNISKYLQKTLLVPADFSHQQDECLPVGLVPGGRCICMSADLFSFIVAGATNYSSETALRLKRNQTRQTKLRAVKYSTVSEIKNPARQIQTASGCDSEYISAIVFRQNQQEHRSVQTIFDKTQGWQWSNLVAPVIQTLGDLLCVIPGEDEGKDECHFSRRSPALVLLLPPSRQVYPDKLGVGVHDKSAWSHV